MSTHATTADLSHRVAEALRGTPRADRSLRAADVLAEAVAAEEPGARLPSLRALSDATGLHRNTLRAALELLADHGAVEREAGGRYRAPRPVAVTVVRPVAPWPWLDDVLVALGPRAVPPVPLAEVDAATGGLVLAAEIELDEVRGRLERAEVLGAGASVVVDVGLALADAPAGARIRVDADPVLAAAVRRVIARVRPDLARVTSGPTDLVLVPAGAVAPTHAEVRRFRTRPGDVELQLILARAAHHAGPPAAAVSSASSSGSAPRQ